MDEIEWDIFLVTETGSIETVDRRWSGIEDLVDTYPNTIYFAANLVMI